MLPPLTGRKYFKRGRHTLSYGASLGLGSMSYELMDVGGRGHPKKGESREKTPPHKKNSIFS